MKIKLTKRQTEEFKNGFIIEIGVACKKCGRTLVIKRKRSVVFSHQVGKKATTNFGRAPELESWGGL